MSKTTRNLASGKPRKRTPLDRHTIEDNMVVNWPRMRRRFGIDPMWTPRPAVVEAITRGVRKGKLITRSRIRGDPARRPRAGHASARTTGIFVPLATEAVEEDRRAGKKRIIP